MAAVFLVLLPMIILQAAAPASSAPAIVEKTTRIKLYWHDVVGGPSPTTVPVAHAKVTEASKSGFGAVVVIDDALTDLKSGKLLGRAQGIYVGAGKDETSLLMAMTFVFQAGRYNGSTLAIMGRNPVLRDAGEMAIVGGTGVFRMARGFAQTRSHTSDNNTGDATVEYNLYIKHLHVSSRP